MRSAQPQRAPGEERRQELEALSGWIAAWRVSVEWLAAYFRKGRAFNWKIQSQGLSNVAIERGSLSGQTCNRPTADDSRCRSRLPCKLNNRCMRVQSVFTSRSLVFTLHFLLQGFRRRDRPDLHAQQHCYLMCFATSSFLAPCQHLVGCSRINAVFTSKFLNGFSLLIQPGLGLCSSAYSGHSSKPFK